MMQNAKIAYKFFLIFSLLTPELCMREGRTHTKTEGCLLQWSKLAASQLCT